MALSCLCCRRLGARRLFEGRQQGMRGTVHSTPMLSNSADVIGKSGARPPHSKELSHFGIAAQISGEFGVEVLKEVILLHGAGLIAMRL